MPLFLPAIQAAREARAVELEGRGGEFVFGAELPAVQDGTSNMMFVGERLQASATASSDETRQPRRCQRARLPFRDRQRPRRNASRATAATLSGPDTYGREGAPGRCH
jgi:hypothetical protein